MKKSLLVSVVALAWLVAGCSAPVVSLDAVTPGASEEVVTPTCTAMPEATPAVAPKASSTPTRTLPPTPAIGTPVSTPDIVATVIAAGPPRILGPYPSPDEQWRAEAVVYDCVRVSRWDEEAYEQLRLVRVDTGDEIIIDTQLLSCGGLGTGGFAGLFWSPNSRYFYYTDAREGGPDGCGEWWERPFLRFDVLNRETEPLGGGPLSPDGGEIATWQGQELVVWSIDEGEIARAPAAVPGALVGPIAWSPDGQSLVYLQTVAKSWCPSLASKSYVVRLDLPEFEPVLLIESNAPVFGYVAWDVPDRLRLSEFGGQKWEFNLATGELAAVR